MSAQLDSLTAQVAASVAAEARASEALKALKASYDALVAHVSTLDDPAKLDAITAQLKASHDQLAAAMPA